MISAKRKVAIIVLIVPISFVLIQGCSDALSSKKIVPCNELPDSLKLVAKNCPQTENVFNKFDKLFTYSEVEKYKKDIELQQIKQRLEEQEMQIEMQRRMMIMERHEREQNQNKPVFILDSQSGLYKNCFRIGETINCN